jgi:adenylate kinase
MINLILFGPPGSGKGTQAAFLVEKYGLIHISTGDLFRFEMGNNTPLGIKAKEYMAKGELVPDEVTIGMLRNKVLQHEGAQGFIFDGFPRTIPQSEALLELLTEIKQPVTALISIKVDKSEIIHRILERGKSSGRADDNNPEIIENRIVVYENETQPVYDFFDRVNLSSEIEGMGSVEEVFQRICQVLDQAIRTP